MSPKKVIVLGVTGGIAAYKSADLVSRLAKKGYEIHVIMTESAQKFVAPLTFRTLTGNQVITELFSEPGAWNVRHISLAEKADLIAIVPATANIMAKVAHGLADDMLSTTIMAAVCPVLFAPAMNHNMYVNPIFQRNLKILEDLSYQMVYPGVGRLACGTEGMGRLADLDLLEAKILSLLHQEQDFAQRKILITAGPTREAIDPVRYISNHSSGKMGYQLAEAARERGAEVHLISGPTCLPDPRGVKITRVISAREMHQAVMENYDQSDVVIKAAAVADYRPKMISAQKIKKSDAELNLALERNPDILMELGRLKKHQLLVGFAAETEMLLENAGEKMKKKNLDLIVANDLTMEGAGFGVDTNIVTLIAADGEVSRLPLMSKKETAHAVLNKINELINEKKKR